MCPKGVQGARLLNAFELPGEFGDIPYTVKAQDYLRGAFRIVNALTPKKAADQAWLRKMSSYLAEQEKGMVGLGALSIGRELQGSP